MRDVIATIGAMPLVFLLLATVSTAQETGPTARDTAPTAPRPDEELARAGEIPVKVVGGRLVAHVELSTVHRRIPANLFVEFDTPCGLRLHNGAAGALKAENEAGETTPISIHMPDFVITVESREMGPEDEYAEFTRLYSREIREDSLVGAIGAKVLSRYRVTFDLHDEVVELELPHDEDAVDPDAPPPTDDEPAADGALEVSITDTDDIVWLPIQLADGTVHAMAVTTTNYDSLVDRGWCDELGFPAGDVGALRIASLDLAQFVAFRPAEVTYVHPDGAIGVIGLNLLEHLRLTINRQRGTATVRVTAPPEFPAADRAFFKALVEEDADQLDAWLDAHPEERLSQEAAKLLLGYRIDEDGTTEQLEKAIRWLRGTWRKDIVTTRALDLMRELRAAGYPLRAVFAGELGVEGGREDRYPNSIHRLHASMGEILLEHDEDRRAWRHLLSAAFGLPDDGRINLGLGRLYEKQKRYSRALSRYVQAVITVDAGEKALEGLQRVQKLTGGAEQLSVDTIEPLIAGKTYSYAAATRYHADPDATTNRVVLVEFFTNTHIKHPSKEEGAIGGALGNEGVLTYFPRDKVAMLAYHLPHPQVELDSLTNELAQSTADRYGAPPAVQVVNGRSQFTGYGHVRDAEKIYKDGRARVLAALAKPSDFELELTATLTGDDLAGTLSVTGPQDAQAVVHIVLAERGVLYPGKSKIVIQRMVARAALTDDAGGQRFEPQDGKMTLAFSRTLESVTRGNVDYLKMIEASGAGSVQPYAAEMDPRQTTIVAFVRDASSNEVLQAIQIDPTLPDDSAPRPTDGS